MYRVLIWGCGLYYSKYINLIKYQEILGEIEIIGVTGRDKLYDYLDGYSFIQLENIEKDNADYIIVTSEKNYNEISVTARKFGFKEEQLIIARVFGLPGFRFGNYINLVQSKVSIISNNCWGGITYHTLGLKFLSPFINMFENEQDYIRLLNNLQYYLGLQLKFKKFGYNDSLQRKYPICELGDIELYFNHYVSMEEVEEKWYQRITRINLDNLFIMMHTENRETLEKFSKLSYSKKVCFVPFESSVQSAFFIKIATCEETKSIPFWEIVNKMAYGYFHDYDMIELLRYGEIKHGRLYKYSGM